MFDFSSDLQSDKPALARAVGILFGGLLVLLSSMTTAAFFWAYAPAVFNFLSPELSPWLAAATGVICFEGASVVWSWLRANDSDTAQQLAIANVGAWGAMIAGLLVTAVYLGLNSSLISGQLDAAAIDALSMMGGVLIVLGIGGNFALGFAYRNAAAGHIAAGNKAQLRALQTAARHRASMATAQATMSRTLAAIQAQLPEQSQRQAAINTARFIASNFDQGQQAQGGGVDYERMMEALDLLLSEDEEEPAITARPFGVNGHQAG